MKNINTLSGLSVANFSKQIDGKETALYTLCNKVGAELAITNYGAKIVSLMVPDKNGKMTDVVTGHNSIEEYLTQKNLISVPFAVVMEIVSPLENSRSTVLLMTN